MKVHEELLERIRQIPTVDSHQHLSPESERTSMHVDALSLYGQYTRFPMFASGLSEDDWKRMHDPDVPLNERWRMAKPHIQRIKHTSFARVACLTLEHFWGVKELSDNNVVAVSERIAADNTPGIYRRVFNGHCNIVRAVNQDPNQSNMEGAEAYRGQSLLLPISRLIDAQPPDYQIVNRMAGPDALGSLDEYLEWARHRLQALADGGVHAFKTVSLNYGEPDRRRALDEFSERATSGEALTRLSGRPGALLSYVHDELLKAVSPLKVPVAVHSGFVLRDDDPAHMIPILRRYPDIHFDLLHAGIPHVRTTGLMALSFPNTTANLCWSHSLNAAMTANALDEYVDLLGIDKIIAFGGDTRSVTVEKTYGHLEMARRNVAKVLAGRIRKELLDLDEATAMARAWFRDNPARIYRVPETPE